MKQGLLFLFALSLSIFTAAQENYTLSGQLTDGATGEDLPFASVIVKGSVGQGTTTNAYGFYSITLPKGSYTIVYQFIGFEPIEKPIELSKNIKLNVELGSNIEQLGPAIIEAEGENENISNPDVGVTEIDMIQMKKIPTPGGEPDPIRIIQMNPGVKQAGEGSSGFYVRGGGLDQNLILLDEAPVYNPSHLLGFFSVFNGDAIRSTKIFKGGMPAEYGGRTASVLDIRMKEGNNKKFGVTGGIGILAGRLTVEGPLKKDKGSFIVSGRRTYLDLFLNASADESINSTILNFYDLNMKANYRINDKNKVFISGYFGRDNFGFSDAFGLEWGNATGTIRWNHLLSDKWFSNTSLIVSNYDYEFGFGVDEDRLAIESVINDLNLKQDLTFYANEKSTLKMGANLIQHRLEPGNISAGSNTGIIAQDAEEKNALEGAVYIQNLHQISKRINLQYGLRYSVFAQYGEGVSYDFDEKGDVVNSSLYDQNEFMQTYGEFEPRFSMSYLLNETSSLKLGYNRNAQYIHLLTNATASSPTDVWIMSSNNVKPQTANQISLGYFKNSDNKQFEFSVEGYYKLMNNVIDYRIGADVFFNEQLEGDLLYGDGEAYGAEFLIKKTQGRLTGWIGYTLSRTLRQIDGINNDDPFPARQDRIHDVSLVAVYDVSPKLSLSMNFVYYTGDAVTFPAGRYTIDGVVTPYYTERNQGRMPDYHRLDLGTTWYNKKTEKFESSWSFSLYNAYGRQNAFSIAFEPSEDDPNVTQAVQTALFRWVPSVTYNFKF